MGGGKAHGSYGHDQKAGYGKQVSSKGHGYGHGSKAGAHGSYGQSAKGSYGKSYGGASLTTPSKHANTITSTTPVRSALMTTSTALPHLPTPRLATLLTSRRHPRARTPCTQVTPRTSGMPMVAIRTSMRRPASTTPVLRPTRPSLTMSGTTTMPISGAPKLGALIRTSTVPLPTVLRPPPASTATPTTLATVTIKELRARSGRVLPHLIRLPLRVTITTRGPSRLTVRTPTPGGASLTIP